MSNSITDIVPYDDSFAKVMAECLSQAGVPCFGPQTGMELLRIQSSVQEFVLKNKSKLDPDIIALLGGYAQRIQDICAIAKFQQGIAIELLESMLKDKEPKRKR